MTASIACVICSLSSIFLALQEEVYTVYDESGNNPEIIQITGEPLHRLSGTDGITFNRIESEVTWQRADDLPRRPQRINKITGLPMRERAEDRPFNEKTMQRLNENYETTAGQNSKEATWQIVDGLPRRAQRINKITGLPIREGVEDRPFTGDPMSYGFTRNTSEYSSRGVKVSPYQNIVSQRETIDAAKLKAIIISSVLALCVVLMLVIYSRIGKNA
jgi:hypothetical protein